MITDTHGAVVSGATVTLMSVHGPTAFVYVTADDGTYKFSFLDAGPYRLTAEAPTFANTESPNLVLASNASRTLDLALKIPEVKAEIEVTETTEVFVTQGAVAIREPEDPLIKAAFRDDLILVAELALKTADINASDVETVRVLLNAGASMSIKNKDGLTALGMAIKYEQEDSVKLLKSRGAPE